MSWHPTLDDIERRTDGPQDQPRRGGSKTPNLPLLGVAGGCWCGDLIGHDWPGKGDGAPHPREAVPA
jgi:hypothetical protein